MHQRQDLVHLNANISRINREIKQHYTHKEKIYQDCHKIVSTIFKYCNLKPEADEAILMLGMTGTGKSTLINLLHGVEMAVSSEGRLVVLDQSKAIAKIAQGQESTTFVPSLCRTSFGDVYDLPGSGDTGGKIIEIMNSVMNKVIGQHLKSVKVVVMLPQMYFKPQGGYGACLAQILEASGKFINNINSYKDSILFVVNFASSNPDLDNIYEALDNYFAHPDGKLQKFEPLLTHAMENNRFKFLSQLGADPSHPLVKSDERVKKQRKEILQELKALEFKSCSSKDFSISSDKELQLLMEKLAKVTAEKIRNIIETSLEIFVLSGIELAYALQILGAIKQKVNLPDWIDSLKFCSFIPQTLTLQNQQLREAFQQLQFVRQFLSHTTEFYSLDWVSNELNATINKVRNRIILLLIEAGGDFRKKFEDQSLLVRPNSPLFPEIERMFNGLEAMYRKKEIILKNKYNNTSQFYEKYKEKVFAGIEKETHQRVESYVEYENRLKIVDVPKAVEYDIQVKKQVVKYQTQQQKYTQMVPKLIPVQKQASIEVRGNGSSMDRVGSTLLPTIQRATSAHFIPILGPVLGPTIAQTFSGLLGGREPQQDQVRTVTFETNEIEYVSQEKIRNVQRPYIQYQTDYVKGYKIQMEKKNETESIPVEKTRIKQVQVDKQIYEDKEMERFDEKKYNAEMEQITSAIQNETQRIAKFLKNIKTPNLKMGARSEKLAKNNYEENYEDLLQIWKKIEEAAFLQSFPNKRYDF